jgi:hypothetical protein
VEVYLYILSAGTAIYQLLFYDDDDYLVGENMNTTKKTQRVY